MFYVHFAHEQNLAEQKRKFISESLAEGKRQKGEKTIKCDII